VRLDDDVDPQAVHVRPVLARKERAVTSPATFDIA